MKPYTNPLPKPPASARARPFDPWNSSSTGHQRREASRRETDGVSETSWRASRALKLNQQFKTQGQPPPPPPLQEGTVAQTKKKKSVAEMLARPGSMKESLPAPADKTGKGGGQKILAGVVVHVNGSTAPLVSDHQLKAVLAAHGARVAPSLARRQVTHVILGRPAAAAKSAGVGCGGGGGLAGSKMEREIRRRGGSGIKYIGVEWVLESIRAGKRLPEARFASQVAAPHGQASVYELSRKPTT